MRQLLLGLRGFGRDTDITNGGDSSKICFLRRHSFKPNVFEPLQHKWMEEFYCRCEVKANTHSHWRQKFVAGCFCPVQLLWLRPGGDLAVVCFVLTELAAERHSDTRADIVAPRAH